MSYSELLNYSFRILGIKNYSEKEMVKKLNQRSKKLSYEQDDSVHKIIIRLKELKLIDDLNYAHSIIRSKTGYKPCGIYMLKQYLMQRFISKEIIETALSEASLNEEELALAYLKRKAKVFSKFSIQEKRKKILRSLAQRGFSGRTISKILQKTADIDTLTSA